MNVLELFAGIGGLGLGLERAGMTVVGQVEIDDYCRRVLAKHWPDVPQHEDVRTCVDWWRAQPRPGVDLIAGGFPCQPVSVAGHRRGASDERWGWPWMAATFRALRPRWVLVENVPGLLTSGMADVLADLAASGYDAQWDCLPAAAVGAPHLRDRVFIVAHATGERRQSRRPSDAEEKPRGRDAGRSRVGPHEVADTDRDRLEEPRVFDSGCSPTTRDWWATEPDVGRVAHGIPHRVDRLRALGNAAVPQVAEHIGRLILAADRAEVTT